MKAWKWTVARKLALSFGTIFFLILAMSLIAHFELSAIRKRGDQISLQRSPSAFACSKLEGTLTLTQKRAVEAMMAGLDPSGAEKSKALLEDSWHTAYKDLDVLESLSLSWDAQGQERYLALKKELPKMHDFQLAAVEIAQSRQRDAVQSAAKVFSQTATPQSQKIRKILNALGDDQLCLLRSDQEKLVSETRTVDVVILAATAVVLLISSLVAFLLGSKISGAANAVLSRAEAIAAGDLTGSRIQVSGNDELADLAAAINKMQIHLCTMISSILENAGQLASASQEFSSFSERISANSEETSAQARVVAEATEAVNSNLQTVATATEQMSASVREIAKNASEAAKVAAAGMQSVRESDIIVNKLGESSGKISQVVKLITSVAQKTDLLALNATIEAARAGQLGAGFGVVATEVKELAKQTADATKDISRKIEAIQGDAKAAVQAIKNIQGIIDQINAISSLIAAAVEQQTATTSEMARNITGAAKGSGEVAENIQGVAQAAQSTSQGATQSQKTATQLAAMSTQLQELVGQFQVDSATPQAS